MSLYKRIYIEGLVLSSDKSISDASAGAPDERRGLMDYRVEEVGVR